jgi:integrase
MLHITDDVCLKSGERKIIIPDAIMKAMREEKYFQYDMDDYIFSTNGKPGIKRLGYHSLRERWATFREVYKIDKRYKLYGLKHTGNTKMAEKGVNMKVLQALNGHHDLEYLQKRYTSEFSISDVNWLKEHQPKLGEIVKPVKNEMDEQTELLKEILQKLNKLNIT